MPEDKIFTLNDAVILNEKGLQLAPTLAGKIGTVINLSKDEYDADVYYIEFGDIQGDFYSSELEFAIETETAFDYENEARSIGKLVSEKQQAYGNSIDAGYEVMKAFLQRYKTTDAHYKFPEELLQHMLLMIRMIDKQNRIFTNPKQDLMGESPYSDLAGYSLLGIKLYEQSKK